MMENKQPKAAPMPRGPKGRRQMGPMPKLENPGKLIKRLLSYVLKKYWLHYLIVIICIIISALVNVQGFLFLGTLIDEYIKPFVGQENVDFSALLEAIIRMAIIYGIGIGANFLQARLMINVTQGTMKSLRTDVFNHMETLPIKYFDTHAHGDIMSVYTNDIDTLRQLISQSIPQTISAIASIVSVLISMISLNVPLTLVSLVMVFVMMMVTKTVAGKSAGYFVQQQASIGKTNGYIEEIMEGQKVVKVFCHEQESMEKFEEINNDVFESSSKAHIYSNILMPIMGNLGNITFVLLAIVGSALAISGISGVFTLGNLVSFLALNKSFNQPVSQVSMQINSIVMALAGAQRVFALLDEKPEVDDGYVELVNAREENGHITETAEHTGVWAWKHFHQADGTTTYTKLEGDVVFDDVDFGYTDEKIVLHNIDIFARPGQKIAFVGATGAGKTTITNLINRFYDLQDGKIRYDGINVNKIKKADLRKSMGVVLQDTQLFTGTVMENIRYGRLDATDEEVKAAARLANADYFINLLPQGYDTMLTGNGGNLSQGQRQLLAIARAAVADPPVLILDEATSSIDSRTEKIVQEGMDRLMHGRTVFVIAHRLSTIMNSDVIMVLDKGHIIERGNHEDLIAKKGVYYQLYTGMLEQD